VTATKEPPALTPDISSRPIKKAYRRSPFGVVDLYKSAVGKKWVMALTGVGLMGFVFFHMVGNLKMYLGPVEFNHYAEFLRELLVPILPRTVTLWLLRIGLIVAFALHIHCAYGLTRINQKARPVKYKSPRDYVAVSFAARTMRWSGIIVGLFLLFHLADLTWGVPAINGEFVRGEAYQNLAYSLDRWPVAIIYILGNLALGFHLYHGGWSLFQTVGSMSPRFNPRHNPIRRGFAAGFAVLVAGINITFPIMVLAGVVGVSS
jgi:succinate dehydrogenase / fumarate reductase, cytochrome b subunit